MLEWQDLLENLLLLRQNLNLLKGVKANARCNTPVQQSKFGTFKIVIFELFC